MRQVYDSKLWRDLRVEILARDGRRCMIEPGCDRPATVVDHIIPAELAPHLAFDPDNLRAGCVFHNSSRVRRPGRVGGSVRRPSREW